MINPLSSLVVSLRNKGFQVTQTTAPVWPSRVWFIDRFDDAAMPCKRLEVHETETSGAAEKKNYKHT